MKTHYQAPHYTTARMQSRMEALAIWQDNMRLLRQIHKETAAKRQADRKAYREVYGLIGSTN